MGEKRTMADEVEPICGTYRPENAWRSQNFLFIFNDDDEEHYGSPWQQHQPRQKHVPCGRNQSLTRALHLAAWQKVRDFSKFGILRDFIQTFTAFSSLAQRSVCLPDAKPFLQSTGGGKRGVHIKVVRIFMHFSDFGWHFLKLFSPRQTLSMKNLNPNG